MILCIDMGNTDITLGFFEQSELAYTFRTATDLKKSRDEYAAIFNQLVALKPIDIQKLEGAILSSVVPSLTRTIVDAVFLSFSLETKLVGSRLKTGLPIRIDNPAELGADLVADSVGALNAHGFPALIVDLGTATKIFVVDKNAAFIGAVIFPGIKVSVKALVGSTSQLFDVSMERPEKILGKNTADSMNSGAIYGTAEMIRGLSYQIEHELGYPLKRILTGGYAHLVKDLLTNDYIYDPNLVLEGLYVLYKKNEVTKYAK